MVFAAAPSDRTASKIAPSNASPSTAASRILRALLALALMATAANFFLKYLWWTACYSAWSGIPKMAGQWKTAGIRSSFYGWSVVLLVVVCVALLYTAMRLRRSSSFLNASLRALASLSITIIGTGFLALVLSWIKQGR